MSDETKAAIRECAQMARQVALVNERDFYAANRVQQDIEERFPEAFEEGNDGKANK